MQFGSECSIIRGLLCNEIPEQRRPFTSRHYGYIPIRIFALEGAGFIHKTTEGEFKMPQVVLTNVEACSCKTWPLSHFCLKIKTTDYIELRVHEGLEDQLKNPSNIAFLIM